MTPAEYRLKRMADKRAEYQRNREKRLAHERTKYLNRKSEYSVRAKDYYRRNKEQIKARVRAYRMKNIKQISEKEKTRRASNRQQERYYSYFLAYKYGITRADYDAMLMEQGGTCANRSCPNNGTEDKRRKRLFVDHCHITGKVRGLLCCACNRMLGMVRDSPARLRGLADYIEAAA